MNLGIIGFALPQFTEWNSAVRAGAPCQNRLSAVGISCRLTVQRRYYPAPAVLHSIG